MGFFRRKKKRDAYQEYLEYQGQEDLKDPMMDRLDEEGPVYQDSKIVEFPSARSSYSIDVDYSDGYQMDDQTEWGYAGDQDELDEMTNIQGMGDIEPYFGSEEIYSDSPYQTAYYPHTEEAYQSSGRRARYSARIDRFLNNGIIIVGVLLLLVMLIAFLA